MANPFVHVELNTTDVPKAKAFYGNLFGWKIEDMPMPSGTYTMINVGEGTGGGIMQHPMPGAPSAWLAYVLVDDIAKGSHDQGPLLTFYPQYQTANVKRRDRLRLNPSMGALSASTAQD